LLLAQLCGFNRREVTTEHLGLVEFLLREPPVTVRNLVDRPCVLGSFLLAVREVSSFLGEVELLDLLCEYVVSCDALLAG